MMRRALFLHLALMLLLSAPCLSEETLRMIDFDTAYQKVLEQSVILKVSKLEVNARQSVVQQVSAYPNPAVCFCADYLGAHSSKECSTQEFNVIFTQPIDLGGKRCARMRVASSDECLADWDQEIALLDMRTHLLHTFIDTALAQSMLNLIEDQKKDVEETLGCICAKNAFGKVALIEEKKAKIACHTFGLTLLKSQSQYEAAKRSLAILWGSQCPDFDFVLFPLHELETPPSLEELEACLADNPELSRADTEVVKAYQVMQLERSQSIPDFAVNAGFTTYMEKCPVSFSLGFTMPIPIFDLNKGNISRASYEHMQAEFRRFDLGQVLRSKLKGLYETWQATYLEAITLRDEIMPAAIETFQIARESYREGKFEYLEMLDNRKTLFEVNNQYLDAAARYQHLKADIERLIASPIDHEENLNINSTEIQG